MTYTLKEYEQLRCQALWEPDPRDVQIDDRLLAYYRETEHMNNRDAMERWREFKSWAYRFGYQSHDINAAKRRCSGKLLDADDKPR